MARNGTTPAIDALSLSDHEDDDTEDLFASPSVTSRKRPTAPQQDVEKENPQTQPMRRDDNAPEDRETLLRRELEALQNMNRVICGITTSLEQAKKNMTTVSATVNNASTLLATWTRILSQTEHNQRLILDPEWQGASQDVMNAEHDEDMRRQEKREREVEELRRSREREVEQEEEERHRLTQSVKGTERKRRGLFSGRGAGRAGSLGGLGSSDHNGGKASRGGGANATRGGTTRGRGPSIGRGRYRGA